MKKKFRIVSMLLTVVLLMSAFLTPVVAGQGNGEGQRSIFAPDGQLDGSNKRLILLHSVAYHEQNHERSYGSIDQYSAEIRRNANLNDQEFEQLARANLKSVIARKEKGERILWDRDFVAQIVKHYFYDLYPVIAKQIEKEDVGQSFEMQSGEVAAQSSFVPGSKTKEFIVTGRSLLGFALYDFVCRIHWVWDSTRITTVLPSTFGLVYDPIWRYAGIVSNIERFTSPTTYYKAVDGHFFSTVNGFILQRSYPWHDIYVRAGGGYTWTSGIR